MDRRADETVGPSPSGVARTGGLATLAGGRGIFRRRTMLSNTDIHYIAGFLYVASHRPDIRVVLGDKILDKASGSSRDVDIVIATAGETGLIGVEVKDESRPLDVSLVEGLCQKLNDMPAISRRGIVSASGYTRPAVKKALAHEVECLTLVRGRVPSFPTIDLSQLTAFTATYLEWRAGPHVTFAPEATLSAEQYAAMIPEAPVQLHTGEVITVKRLADRTVALATSSWDPPLAQAGPFRVSIDVTIEDVPRLQLGSDSLPLANARIQGVVEWVSETVPVEDSCYLQSDGGSAFTGTVLLPLRTGLLGLAVSAKSQELRTFHIPEAVRNVRPTRVQIFPPIKNGA